MRYHSNSERSEIENVVCCNVVGLDWKPEIYAGTDKHILLVVRCYWIAEAKYIVTGLPPPQYYRNV